MRKLLLLVTIPLAFACKKPTESDFDRGAMLDNMASSVIIPAVNDLESSLANLKTAADNFVASIDVSTLNTLKTEFQNVYLDFQHVKMFNFGPILDYGVKAGMNTYPTDTAKIEGNIVAGSYVLGGAGNIDAIGLPALDYLLYFPNETAVLDNFSTDADRTTYLIDLVEKMQSEYQLAANAWNASYKASFVSADGTDVGSSTGIMFNEFVQDIELLKNAKIGIPGGQFSAGEPLPEMTEGHYSKFSKQLALESVTALKIVFQGGVGSGYDDYIIDVESEVEVSLATNMINQFNLIYDKIDALGSDFNTDVTTNFDGFQEAFLEIKKLVTYSKTDMASILGLQITFSDSDGD